jgi:hypothetical protein
MPPYLYANGLPAPGISVYPGHNAHAVGYLSKGPGAPSPWNADQYELVTQGYTSIPVAVAAQTAWRGYTGRTVIWEILYSGGSPPSPAITLVLQGSIDNSDFVTVDTSTNTSGEVRQTNITGFRYFRVVVQTLSGSVLAQVKITCM